MTDDPATTITVLIATRHSGITGAGPAGYLGWKPAPWQGGGAVSLPDDLLPRGQYGEGASIRVTVEVLRDVTPAYLPGGLWERNTAARSAADHALRTLTAVQDWGYGPGPWEQVGAELVPEAQLLAREWIDQQLAGTTATTGDRARLHAQVTELVTRQWEAGQDRLAAAERQAALRAARETITQGVPE